MAIDDSAALMERNARAILARNAIIRCEAARGNLLPSLGLPGL
jgi:hypothetical protein